jgi:hypothetical protein
MAVYKPTYQGPDPGLHADWQEEGAGNRTIIMELEITSRAIGRT